MRAWFCIALVAGCGRIAFDRVGDAGIDGTVGDGTLADACMLGPFGPAVSVGNVNSVGADSGPALTADGLDLYFSSNRAGGLGGFDIWHASRATRQDPWGTPVNLPNVNTTSDELSPAVSFDGLTMYFSRDNAGNLDLVLSSRVTTADAFGSSSPINDPNLNTTVTEDSASPTGDGLSLLFASDRTGGLGGNDLYLARRPDGSSPYDTFVHLMELSSSVNDRGAALSYDGLTVVFASSRGPMSYQLYLATRPDMASAFSMPTMLTAPNSTAADDDAALSADTTELYFASDRVGSVGSQDLYVSTRACL